MAEKSFIVQAPGCFWAVGNWQVASSCWNGPSWPKSYVRPKFLKTISSLVLNLPSVEPKYFCSESNLQSGNRHCCTGPPTCSRHRTPRGSLTFHKKVSTLIRTWRLGLRRGTWYRIHNIQFSSKLSVANAKFSLLKLLIYEPIFIVYAWVGLECQA